MAPSLDSHRTARAFEPGKPMVSVIVPVFNVSEYLDQALESIERQTLRAIEIICVNDGSTDDSLSIMEEHARRDDRIRIIDKPNGGYGSACNRGFDEAKGTWIAILEPDDWIAPEMYANMVGFAATFNEAPDIVKTPYWRMVFPDTDRQQRLNCSYRHRIKPKSQPFTMDDPGVAHLMMHHPSIWSAIYRADFIRSCGIRMREIPGAGWADNPFLAETLCQAKSIVYLDKPYYCYREETPEQAENAVKKNPLVPVERWHDIQDVIDRLGVTSPGVIKSQIRRGFTYLDPLSTIAGLDETTLHSEMQRMFARMDDDLVLAEPQVSPAWKKTYCHVKGLSEKNIGQLPYLGSLVANGTYNVVNIGPRATVRLVSDVLDRDRAQAQMPEDAKGAATSTPESAVEPSVSVSIIVPVYNSEAYLRDSLGSVEAQTYGNIEVVLVDDGSTDGSRSILEEFAADHDYAVVVAKSNGGPSSARNVGIRNASGDFVCFLDADDQLEPDACLRIAQSVEVSGCDVIAFGWTCIPANQANRWLTARTDVRDATFDSFSEQLMFDEMVQPYLRSAVRRELLIDEAIFFDEQLRVGEDAQFLFAVYPRARGAKLISDKLYRYRLPHAGSIMYGIEEDVAEKSMNDLNMMISIFADWDEGGLLAKHGARLVEWYTQFLLYTILRMPSGLRDSFVSLTRALWLAHFSAAELKALAVPAHAALLIDTVVDADEQGKLSVSEAELHQRLLRYRLAEYGVKDIVDTIQERLGR